ncbi:apolipoprotein N-acyltransferase [Oceaniserpentilla sp. 4NH20-0058]|uniref:apolipoprotein N-acyltransferase n=1 Tax=Oceaniserpentilla sp. 4NH20-0058 TaxID=3127660 RepID=UPI00310B3786
MTAASKNWQTFLPPLNFWLRTLLALVGGLLLGLSHINSDLFILAWVALLPLLIAIKGTTLKESYFLGFVFGLGLYTVGAFWIVDFLYLFKSYAGAKNYIFSSLFWIYCSQMPACLALTYQWLSRNSPIPNVVLFPTVTAFYFACFPVLFSAQLGETQSQFTTALQAIEFTGVYGLDMIMALFSITLFNLLKGEHNKQQLAITGSVFVIWFGYGAYSKQAWEETMATWNTTAVGFVQPNEIPTIQANDIITGYSRTYPPELDMTERLVEAGAELIVWPEAKYKDYINNELVKKAYLHNIRQLNVDLIFQDMETQQSSTHGKLITQKYNAAVMIDKYGKQQPLYRKQKRVAFGEYVPLVSDIPALRMWVEDFFGNFLNEIGKGSGPVIFTAAEKKLIPLICYETMFPEFVANAVPQDARGSILVGLSSNGWFGKSVQPYQHVYSASLRAIENRTPMIHALNNGPSVAVLPNGRFLFMSPYHQAGGYLVDLPYSEHSGGSLFSRHPWITLSIIYGILLFAILMKLPIARLLKSNALKPNNN